MKHLANPLVVSGFFWLIPAALAWTEGYILLATLALIMCACSTWYHVSLSPLSEKYDTVFALLYILVGPYLLLTLEHSHSDALHPGFYLSLYASLLALLVFVISKLSYAKKRQAWYVLSHSLWHLSAVFVATLVYMIFLGYLY